MIVYVDEIFGPRQPGLIISYTIAVQGLYRPARVYKFCREQISRHNIIYIIRHYATKTRPFIYFNGHE